MVRAVCYEGVRGDHDRVPPRGVRDVTSSDTYNGCLCVASRGASLVYTLLKCIQQPHFLDTHTRVDE